MEISLAKLRRAIIRSANQLITDGLVSRSKHGNISVRIPGTDRMLLTAVGSLRGLTEKDIALFDLSGKLVKGSVDPVNREIIGMHTVVYNNRPDVNCVIHTHAPHSTAFAIAGRPIEPVYEALVRWGITEPIPVAGYGPRGSEVALKNIERVLGSNKACLLENHGLLAFSKDLDETVHVICGMEEAAQMSIYASLLGKPKLIPKEMMVTALSRAKDFEKSGTMRA